MSAIAFSGGAGRRTVLRASRLRGPRRPVVSRDRQLRRAQGARRPAHDRDRRAPAGRRQDVLQIHAEVPELPRPGSRTPSARSSSRRRGGNRAFGDLQPAATSITRLRDRRSYRSVARPPPAYRIAAQRATALSSTAVIAAKLAVTAVAEPERQHGPRFLLHELRSGGTPYSASHRRRSGGRPQAQPRLLRQSRISTRTARRSERRLPALTLATSAGGEGPENVAFVQSLLGNLELAYPLIFTDKAMVGLRNYRFEASSTTASGGRHPHRARSACLDSTPAADRRARPRRAQMAALPAAARRRVPGVSRPHSDAPASTTPGPGNDVTVVSSPITRGLLGRRLLLTGCAP